MKCLASGIDMFCPPLDPEVVVAVWRQLVPNDMQHADQPMTEELIRLLTSLAFEVPSQDMAVPAQMMGPTQPRPVRPPTIPVPPASPSPPPPPLCHTRSQPRPPQPPVTPVIHPSLLATPSAQPQYHSTYVPLITDLLLPVPSIMVVPEPPMPAQAHAVEDNDEYDPSVAAAFVHSMFTDVPLQRVQDILAESNGDLGETVDKILQTQSQTDLDNDQPLRAPLAGTAHDPPVATSPVRSNRQHLPAALLAANDDEDEQPVVQQPAPPEIDEDPISLLQMIFPNTSIERITSLFRDDAQGDLNLAMGLLHSAPLVATPSADEVMQNKDDEETNEMLETLQAMFPQADAGFLGDVWRHCGTDFDITVDILRDMVPESTAPNPTKTVDVPEQQPVESHNRDDHHFSDLNLDDQADEPEEQFSETDRRNLGLLIILYKSVDIRIIQDVYLECNRDSEETKRILRDVYDLNITNRQRRKASRKLRYGGGGSSGAGQDSLSQPTGGNAWTSRPQIRPANAPQKKPHRPLPASSSLAPLNNNNALPLQRRRSPFANSVMNAHDLQLMEQRLLEKRNEFARRAAEEFQRGRRDVARYYSNRAHEYKQKIQECRQMASQLRVTSAEQAFSSSPNRLDLHGFRVHEALHILEKKLSESRTGPLMVITGAGRHSPNGEPRIRPAVFNYLMQRRIPFNMVNEGALSID